MLLNCEQICKMIGAASVNECLKDRIAIAEPQKKHIVKCYIECMHTMFDMLEKCDEIKICGSIPNMASMDGCLKSKEMGKIVAFGLKMSVYDQLLKKKYRWECE
jgi:hypothetical protein